MSVQPLKVANCRGSITSAPFPRSITALFPTSGQILGFQMPDTRSWPKMLLGKAALLRSLPSKICTKAALTSSMLPSTMHFLNCSKDMFSLPITSTLCAMTDAVSHTLCLCTFYQELEIELSRLFLIVSNF